MSELSKFFFFLFGSKLDQRLTAMFRRTTRLCLYGPNAALGQRSLRCQVARRTQSVDVTSRNWFATTSPSDSLDKRTQPPAFEASLPEMRPKVSRKLQEPQDLAEFWKPLRELNAELYRQVVAYSSVEQSPVSINYLIRLGTKLSPLKSLLFNQLLLHNELPIRIARVILELDQLPLELRKSASLTELRREYVDSFTELLSFPQCAELVRVLSLPDTCGANGRPLATVDMARLVVQYQSQLDAQLLTLFPESNALSKHLQVQRDFVEMLEKLKHRHRTDILRIALGLAQYKNNCLTTGRAMIELNSDEIQHFLEQFNRRRIGIRLIQGQHIALMRSFENNGKAVAAAESRVGPKVNPSLRRVGIIDPYCDIVEVIETSALDAQRAAQSAYARQLSDYNVSVPDVHIKYAMQDAENGSVGATPQVKFSYVPSILYHIVYELLKNSLRATMEKEFLRKNLPTLAASAPLADESNRHSPVADGAPGNKNLRWWRFLLPVSQQRPSGIVTALDEQRERGDGLYFDPISIVVSVGKEDLMIKVSDIGGGISRLNLDKFGSFMYSSATPPTIERLESLSQEFSMSSSSAPDVGRRLKTARDLLHAMPLCGLGYGIPISKLYAAYLGGCLEIVSMEGFGTDAYLYLKKVGDLTEDLRD